MMALSISSFPSGVALMLGPGRSNEGAWCPGRASNLKMGPARRKETQRKVIPRDPFACVDHQEPRKYSSRNPEHALATTQNLLWRSFGKEEEGRCLGMEIRRSEVNGIFKRDVPEHNAPCSDGATVTIDVIFFARNRIGVLFCWLRGTQNEPEIPPENDNNTLFVDGGLTCIQRLYQGCCRRKKHTLLFGGQKHLHVASQSFHQIQEVHNGLKEYWV
ncbi:hypothetical protein TIFTF001_032715 [Ficus carica]|uniref:Uncharacterized protein n=1 Tax=Ficus carica TaxID=3494 RepID=A0AA88E3Y4_FICCA|nr:hypothetical protein TIFTF001_032669 [Ficus carica]GMN63644.1 hypothetical protein TIFTF001_032715 [Ficus carica]